MIFQNGNGILITENGKQQTTWKKIGGQWKVIEDTATSNAPLPVFSTIVQVHGVGPFVVNYVNPADDPSKK